MSNQRTDPPATDIPNVTETGSYRSPIAHNTLQTTPVQKAIVDWVMSIEEGDNLTMEAIERTCWMLEPVAAYVRGDTPASSFMTGGYRKQLVSMYISQAFRCYIDTVVIAGRKKVL